LSIRAKWNSSIILSTLMVLGIAGSVIITFQYFNDRQAMAETIRGLHDSLRDPLIAAKHFDQPEHIINTFGALRSIEGIDFAAFYTPQKTLYVCIPEEDAPLHAVANWSEPEDVRYTRSHLTVFRPLMNQTELVGFIEIRWKLTSLYARLRASILIFLVSAIFCMSVAYLLGKRLIKKVTEPLEELVATTTSITQKQEYSLRAKKKGDDEMGLLTDAFNEMLDLIQHRDADLRKANTELELAFSSLSEDQQKLQDALARETELKDKLERAHRMESLGVLAGGIAHDLNNLLGPLVGYPDLIMDEIGEDHPAGHDVKLLKTSAVKCSEIVSDLLTMARRGTYTKETVFTDEFFEEFQNSPACKKAIQTFPDVEIQFRLAKNLWPVVGSISHITQVLINLVNNAAEAIQADHGWVIISAENLDSPGDESIGLNHGEYVKIEVKDTGTGIHPDHLPKIFEPFYTRKEMGRSGSGLGLSIVFGIISDFGGIVDVESTLGQGTTFTVYLPRDLNPIRALEKRPVSDLKGKESILVVDDLSVQRDLSRDVLRHLGYECDSVETGEEAIAYLSEHSVDLVILDMILGDGPDGLDVYLEIIKQWPNQRCIIASGYNETARVRQAEDLGVLGYVPKPYTRETLGMGVRNALDQTIERPDAVTK